MISPFLLFATANLTQLKLRSDVAVRCATGTANVLVYSGSVATIAQEALEGFASGRLDRQVDV